MKFRVGDIIGCKASPKWRGRVVMIEGKETYFEWLTNEEGNYEERPTQSLYKKVPMYGGSRGYALIQRRADGPQRPVKALCLKTMASYMKDLEGDGGEKGGA